MKYLGRAGVSIAQARDEEGQALMLWVKAFHISFMVTWFAGLFYLPRLFVYHAMSSDEISNDRFKIMERKLFFGIMTPGAILTAATGAWLAVETDAIQSGAWFHAKMALVLGLIVYHVYCGKLLIDFKRNRNVRSHVYYRWFNEVPVVILFGAIVLVVVKPF